MQVAKYFGLLDLFSLCNAFSVPEGITEGVYQVGLDKYGNEIHEALNGTFTYTIPSKVRAVQALRLERRQAEVIAPGGPGEKPETRCGCGYNMNHRDCDAAVAELTASVNREPNGVAFLPFERSWYSIKGGVVAFLCNRRYPGGSRGSDLTNRFQQITNRCGWYVAGTFRTYSIFSSIDTGYMIMGPGVTFCESAWASPRPSC